MKYWECRFEIRDLRRGGGAGRGADGMGRMLHHGVTETRREDTKKSRRETGFIGMT